MATFHTCLTFGLILLQKSSMDWAKNESWCQQISFKSSPKVETSVVTLGQLMLQNGLLFISTSGHTGCIRPQNRSRVQCDQIGLFWNILAAKFRPKLYLAAFWAIWKNITLYVKPTMATFCQLFNKIGLLFIPLSGHTESCDENDSRRHNTCEKCTIPNSGFGSGTILIFWLKTSSVTSFVNILSFWQYFESHWRLCDGLFSV